MISRLDRKLLRDLTRLKGQAIAVAVVMACGLAMMITTRSLIASLEGARSDYYEGYRFADVFGSLKRAPNHLADRLAALPGVAGVQTDIAGQVTLDLPGVDEPASGLVRSLPDFGGPELNRLYLRRGRWLSPSSHRELLVGEAFADANHLNPGDALTLIMNGRRQDFRVAGIVLSPEYIFESRPGAALPDSHSYGIFWMTYKEVATAWDLYGAFNHFALKLAPGADPAPVIAAADQLLKPYGGLGAYGRRDHPSHIRVSDEIRTLTILSIGFPAIFLSVAAFMTNAVLTRLLALQREQIAILKAFGFSDGAIIGHYLKFAGAIGLGGTLLGGLLGQIQGRWMIGLYAPLYRFPALPFRLDGVAMTVAFGVGLLAVVAGVLSSVRKAARIPPAEAMRPEPPANYRPSFIERPPFARWFSHPFRIAVRNLERRPMQAFFTVAGLALATALLILPNTMKSSIADILDNQWDVVQRQDINLGLAEPSAARIEHDFERLPGVIHVEPARTFAARIHFHGANRQIGVRSLEPGGLHSRAIGRDGREILPPPDGIVVSAKLAEVLGAKVGDELVVEALEGRRPVRAVRLAGLALDFSGIAAYMDRTSINRFLGEGDIITGASFTIDANQRVEFLHALKGIPRISWIAVKNTLRESFRTTTAKMMGMLTTLYLSMAVVVAFGVIYNNARISLAERARELATLRVIGLTQREVGSVIIVELGLLALAAVPCGLLLGTGIAAAIISTVNTETVRLPLVFTSYTYTFAVLVVVGSSLLSAFVVLRKLKQLDLIGALKAPE